MDKSDITSRPARFNWHIFPGHTAPQIKREIQTFLRSTEPFDFKERIMFMSMFNDIECWKPGNNVPQTQQRLPDTRSNSSWVLGVSVGLDKRARTNQTEHGITSPGNWHRSLQKLHIQYSTVLPFLNGDFKTKKGKETIHFQSDNSNKDNHYSH